jgi:glycosyl transferase, family 25
MLLGEFFDRISIIHLPEREDRYTALARELRGLQIDIRESKVEIPFAPKPKDRNGFPSCGVYGNFLSHFDILSRALKDGLQNIWVLEDDAIFSRRMARTQAALVNKLESAPWDLCFFGHSPTPGLPKQPEGLVPSKEEFIWAHCYAVNARVLPRLVAYMNRSMELPVGHSDGARVYIDAAFTLFRRQNPDVLTLLSNPTLSVQKGCLSSLNDARWYDRYSFPRPFIAAARRVRDEWWKLTV